jgi:hypothetical protein
MSLKFGFLIFWQKDFGAKASHKMLVKLTPALLTKVNKVRKGRKAAIPVVGIFVFLKFCQCHTLLESIALYFKSALFII